MNMLRKIWRWSTEIPETSEKRLQRAQELVVVSVTLLAIEAVVIVIEVAVLWTQIQSVWKALR